MAVDEASLDSYLLRVGFCSINIFIYLFYYLFSFDRHCLWQIVLKTWFFVCSVRGNDRWLNTRKMDSPQGLLADVNQWNWRKSSINSEPEVTFMCRKRTSKYFVHSAFKLTLPSIILTALVGLTFINGRSFSFSFFAIREIRDFNEPLFSWMCLAALIILRGWHDWLEKIFNWLFLTSSVSIF